MRSISWKSVAEFVGIGAIVASLVFVGLQLKQSQEIAIAAQYHDRAEASMNLALAHLEADYVPLAFRHGLSDDISAGDINTFHWLWISQDNHYYQYQLGFMAEESWQTQLQVVKTIYSLCDFRFVWMWRKESGERSEFVALVDSLPDPCTEVVK